MSLIASWHPTYALFHNPYEWGAFEIDLHRFARLVRGQLREEPKRLVIHPTSADVLAVVTNCCVAVDIETRPASRVAPWTGKDATQAKLKTIGLGNEDWGLSWLVTKADPVGAAIAAILADSAIVKEFLNGPWFDLRVLRRFGYVVRNWTDARDRRRALSSTSPLSLGYQTSLADDAKPWKEKEEDDAKGLVFTDDMDKLRRYNAQDCVETARVRAWHLRESDWPTPRVQRLYRYHTLQSTIAAEMHTTGVLVDQGRRSRLADELQSLFDQRSLKLANMLGIPGFKPNANSMRALLFKRYAGKCPVNFGLPDPIGDEFYTETGAISVDQRCLLMLMADPLLPEHVRPVVDAYWAAYAARQARSTFVVSKLVSQAIGPDGRLRAGWNSCGTDTGRWSCSEPNVMNLSKDKDGDKGAMSGDLPNIRTMYVPRQGHVFVHADYSQLELRVMAIVAQDDELQRRLDAKDVYSADARDWFDLPADMDVKKLKPEARQSAKIIHLASQYGAGTETVYAQTLEQDRMFKYQLCELLHSAFKRTYSRTIDYWTEEWMRVVGTDEAAGSGYSEDRVLGRRRVYPRVPKPTEVNNYPIQSTAAAIMGLGLIRAWAMLKRYVPSARVVFQLHDAIDVECAKRHAPEVSRIVTEAMEHPMMFTDGARHVFPVEAKTTDESWGAV